jgi:hypothetical protein
MERLSGQVLTGAIDYLVSQGTRRRRWRPFTNNMKKMKKAPDLFPRYPVA